MATPEKENPLFMSWHNSAWIPHLSRANIMDYFADRSNPFYDRTCNNEIIKMQRVNPEQLKTMTGLEYELLHVQEPILYVIRKQHRHSVEHTTPLANYYIIAGVVYQAPDLCSVLNSRMLTSLHHIESAFEEAQSFSRYSPSKGYWWEFKDKEQEQAEEKQKNQRKKEEAASSMFQRQRVDVLLKELSRKFPPKVIQAKPGEKPIPVEHQNGTVAIKEEIKEEQQQVNSNSVATTGTIGAPNAGAFFSGGMRPPMVKKRKLGK
ncbi:mediator of RNA polymerase II transcription subunit 6-like [Acanthaster planci]|uniref:Mediator of RNA polymerase II transcription subunit 6 n=1 Tax=Acanthaster planci TaxID=133434 RepID=A0A8B7XKT4_ACAPL|nr:mediator of RNA polymerase II transcription subunit 6-like [Acanthaster planci]